jgi:hypothetical protein
MVFERFKAVHWIAHCHDNLHQLTHPIIIVICIILSFQLYLRHVAVEVDLHPIQRLRLLLRVCLRGEGTFVGRSSLGLIVF